MKNLFTSLIRKNFIRNRKIYTQPLNVSDMLTVASRRYIPPHITKPPHADNDNYAGNKSYSIITNEEDIKKIRQANQIAGEAVRLAVEGVENGSLKTTDDIDILIHDYIISQNAYPSGVGFMGFPKSVCTSLNEVVCHGIPNKRPLRKGDSLNIDVTAYYEGFHGDTSAMACVGEVDPEIKRLIKVTRESLFKAIEICRPGQKFSKIGEVIEDYVVKNGFVVCREFSGHGIGKDIHMGPTVFHFKHDDEDNSHTMQKGMVFTIEPIVLLYPYTQLYMWEDDWTVISKDNISAQWEHSILITENGYDILSKRKDEILLI